MQKQKKMDTNKLWRSNLGQFANRSSWAQGHL